MLSAMPLLSAYWPYLITVVLVYVIYVLIFGNNQNDSTKTSENAAIQSKSQRGTKQTNNETTVYKDDDDGEEVDDEVSPTTFPEDTPHIPYEFKEISEVGLFQMSILSRNIKHIIQQDHFLNQARFFVMKFSAF